MKLSLLAIAPVLLFPFLAPTERAAPITPVEHTLASVTVIHPEAAWADAWATALNVLGPVDGPALAEEQALAAYFNVRADEGFENFVSDPFRAYLVPETPADR